MGWLSFFTGGSKTADTVVDGISNGLDKMFFTDEEKAEASKEGFQLYLKYQEATQPQNVARRQLALSIVFVWLFFVVIAGAGIVFSLGYVDNLIKFLDKIMHWPVVTIIGFYFLKRMSFASKKDPK